MVKRSLVHNRSAPMTYEQILTEINDGVLTITMNRPEKLNAWTHQMANEMVDAITTANADDDVIAIILTGAGRGFCAGADMAAVFEANAEGTASDADGPRDWVGLMRSSKPIVAAVNGACIGVGFSQILSMDHIVAAEGAKLSLRFVKVGVVPELASSQLVPMRVGFGRASDLMLTGRIVLAEEAASISLIDRVVPADELMTAAHEMAHAMGENPQVSIRLTKELITANMGEASLADVQRRELTALAEAYRSPEHAEAVSAFLEKREPDFSGARRAAERT